MNTYAQIHIFIASQIYQYEYNIFVLIGMKKNIQNM